MRKMTLQRQFFFALIVGLVGLVSNVPSLEAANRDDLPERILAAFGSAYPDATILNVSREKHDGVRVWEIESDDAGTERDLLYAEDGSVLEIEEEIAVADLPEPVRSALTELGGRVVEAEKVIRGDKVSYEIAVRKGLFRREILLGPDGKEVVRK